MLSNSGPVSVSSSPFLVAFTSIERSLTSFPPRAPGDNFRNFVRMAELEDIVHIQSNPTLSRLDATLKRFITFCASYHGEP